MRVTEVPREPRLTGGDLVELDRLRAVPRLLVAGECTDDAHVGVRTGRIVRAVVVVDRHVAEAVARGDEVDVLRALNVLQLRVDRAEQHDIGFAYELVELQA